MADEHRTWRRQDEGFWRAHHEAWKRSDLNQRQYCEAEGIPLKAFGNWRVDAWASRNGVSRSEAIRRLVEIGLANTPKTRRPGLRKGAARASDMAAEELELLADQSATDEQRLSGKRRLLRGPNEFRDVRNDLPKRRG